MVARATPRTSAWARRLHWLLFMQPFHLLAAIAVTTATLSACLIDPSSDEPTGSGADCCLAACIASAGVYQFVSSGQPVEVVGRVVITDLATNEVLLDQELNGFDRLETTVGNHALRDYEDSTALVRVDVTAAGFANVQQEVTLSVQHSEICCDSCSTSSESFDIELTTSGS